MQSNVMKSILTVVFLPCFLIVLTTSLAGQEPAVNWPDYPATPPNHETFAEFIRGDIWHTSSIGAELTTFSRGRDNWGLDFPGFDDQFIKGIGRFSTHLSWAGFAWGALKEKGLTDPTVEQTLGAFEAQSQLSSAPTGTTPTWSNYNSHVWPNGENYWLQTDSEEAEEKTVNVILANMDIPEENRVTVKWSPFNIVRIQRMWSGSVEDQFMVIVERFLKNVGDVTAFDVYTSHGWAPQINWRSMNRIWSSNIVADDMYFFDDDREMIWMRDDDYKEPVSPEVDIFDFNVQGGPTDETTGNPTGEWMAPGHLGFKLIYHTPTSDGKTTQYNSWEVGEQGFWNSGYPFGAGAGDRNIAERWQVNAGYLTVPVLVSIPDDIGYGQFLHYLIARMGPWDLAPGEFIRVVNAEILGTIDFTATVNPNTTAALVGQVGEANLTRLADKAQFIWEQVQKGNGWNIPDAPAAPDELSIEVYTDQPGVPGNLIKWDDNIDDIVDTDYGVNDTKEYRVWRAQYTPLGPWELLGTVQKGDATYMDADGYRFPDTDVRVGRFYYYGVSAVDEGHSEWIVDPDGWEAFHGSRAVPALESIRTLYKESGQAVAYKTRRAPGADLSDIRVYPNPYAKSSGFETRTEADQIFFAKIPLKCTIRIYTLRGDLIKTYHHESDDAEWGWDMITSAGQWIESGVYFFVVDSEWGNTEGQSHAGKFMVMR